MLGYKNQNSSFRSSLIKGNEQSSVEWVVSGEFELTEIRVIRVKVTKKQGQIQRRKDRKFELPSCVDWQIGCVSKWDMQDQNLQFTPLREAKRWTIPFDMGSPGGRGQLTIK